MRASYLFAISFLISTVSSCAEDPLPTAVDGGVRQPDQAQAPTAMCTTITTADGQTIAVRGAPVFTVRANPVGETTMGRPGQVVLWFNASAATSSVSGLCSTVIVDQEDFELATSINFATPGPWWVAFYGPPPAEPDIWLATGEMAPGVMRQRSFTEKQPVSLEAGLLGEDFRYTIDTQDAKAGDSLSVCASKARWHVEGETTAYESVVNICRTFNYR